MNFMLDLLLLLLLNPSIKRFDHSSVLFLDLSSMKIWHMIKPMGYIWITRNEKKTISLLKKNMFWMCVFKNEINSNIETELDLYDFWDVWILSPSCRSGFLRCQNLINNMLKDAGLCCCISRMECAATWYLKCAFYIYIYISYLKSEVLMCENYLSFSCVKITYLSWACTP